MTKRRALIAVVFVLALVGLYLILWSGPTGPTGEVISPDEAQLSAQIVASAIATAEHSHETMLAHPPSDSPPGDVTGSGGGQPYRRDAHAKSIGCLRATFQVLDSLDPSLRKGLFAAPGEYHAWIRYSNGNTLVRNDGERDARGMAIKVMGVPGRKLLEDEGMPHAETQDFLLMNAPHFFIRNLSEYAEFMNYLERGSITGYFLGGFTPNLPQKNWSKLLNFAAYHPRESLLAWKDKKPPPDSLLNTQFYSVSAYRLGSDRFVKYSVRPCRKASAAAVNREDPNFLRTEMAQRLQVEDACFEFLVQLQRPDKYMPVEDTTIEWKETDSAFVPVARIEIPKQEFVGNQDVCEDLSFNPWHALPDHRPVGALNRVRKQVYLNVARYRRGMNGNDPLCEQKDWRVEDPGSCEPPGNSPSGASPTSMLDRTRH